MQVFRRALSATLLAVCCAANAGEAEWKAHMEAGGAAQARGEHQQALDRFVEAVKEATAFGERDPRLAAARAAVRKASIDLAHSYRADGRYAEAEAIHRRALAFYEKTLGAEHPETLGQLADLVEVLLAQGLGDEAAPLQRLALSGASAVRLRDTALAERLEQVANMKAAEASPPPGQASYPFSGIRWGSSKAQVLAELRRQRFDAVTQAGSDGDVIFETTLAGARASGMAFFARDALVGVALRIRFDETQQGLKEKYAELERALVAQHGEPTRRRQGAGATTTVPGSYGGIEILDGAAQAMTDWESGRHDYLHLRLAEHVHGGGAVVVVHGTGALNAEMARRRGTYRRMPVPLDKAG